jgi:hypothetical protein
MKVLIGVIAIVLPLMGPIKAKAIVGYYNQVFTPGNNLFAVAMLSGSNTLSQLFPSAIPEGTTISLYNPATTNFDIPSTFSGGSWSMNLSLLPGMGAVLNTPRAFTNTFFGIVLNHDGSPWHGDPIIPLPPVLFGTNGVCLLGDKMMIINVGTNIFLNIIGRMPYVGEQLYKLSGSSTYLGNGMWDSIPTLNQGEAAFFFSNSSIKEPPSFLNLDFESSIITSSQPAWWFNGNTGKANMPGWTEFNGWGDTNYSGGASVIYNDQTLDAPGVSLWDKNYPNPAIQGNLSVYLYGGSSAYTQAYPGWPTGASIYQTLQIPITAKSISYWGLSCYNGLQVTFNGQLLAFINTSNAANHSVYTADISAYAGQTGQLEFAAPWQSYGILDNIQFSSSPILELPPKLSIVCSNNQAIVSWPSATSIWTLQTNSNLATGGWGNYTGLINNNTVTNSISGQNLFFRLSHQ